jgi:hypothetical protein
MPVIEVAITPFGQVIKPLLMPALVDSGADGSMIPLKILQSLKARITGQVNMRTVTGVRSVVNIYEVSLRIAPHTFPKVRVAADRYNSVVVLGRDVLNHLVITLNGLATTTEIHD